MSIQGPYGDDTVTDNPTIISKELAGQFNIDHTTVLR